MTHPEFLQEVVVLFATAIMVGAGVRMLHIPAILGFLLAGMVIGPYGAQLIQAEQVSQFAEIGLVLLLFTVGLELSPRLLMQTGRQLVIVIAVQFALIVPLTAGALWLTGVRDMAALVIVGIAVTLSSTAIVLNMLSDRGESSTTKGLIATGVLLLQDVAVIAVMLLLPMIAATGGDEPLQNVLLRQSMYFVAMAALIVALRWLLPRLVTQLYRYGGRELLTLFAVLMAAGGAWLAGLAHWSLALGACIAGLLLAESDRRHHLVAEITPFRDVFNALFFISLGMLVNLPGALDHIWLLLAAVAATIVLKSLINTGAVLAAGWPLRMAMISGISLCTVSEFAYVLAFEAYDLGMLPQGIFDLLTAFTVGTMLAGAILFPAARPIADAVQRIAPGLTPPAEPMAVDGAGEGVTHHVILVGFGVTGVNVARLLQAAHLPFIVVEMNQNLVRQAREMGAQVVVGDATRLSLLEHAGLAHARVLVVAINDPDAAQRIVGQVSHQYPHLFTVVRVRFVAQLERLKGAGADLVVPEEFEASIEIGAHVLQQYRVPSNIVNAQLASLRAGNYAILRGRATDRAMASELIQILQQTVTESFYLREEFAAVGQTLAELHLRAETGANVIAVVRNAQASAAPPSDFRIEAGDVLVLVGPHASLDAARELLETGRTREAAQPEDGEAPPAG